MTRLTHKPSTMNGDAARSGVLGGLSAVSSNGRPHALVS